MGHDNSALLALISQFGKAGVGLSRDPEWWRFLSPGEKTLLAGEAGFPPPNDEHARFLEQAGVVSFKNG